MRAEPSLSAEALAAFRAVLANGAAPIDCPILQPLSLLLDVAGEAMRARLFIVQAEGGVESCLRPDFTVAVARAHLESGATAGRYFYEGHVFRASQGPDWPEEFLQMGVESFAADGGDAADLADADADIAALAWRAAATGGRGDLSLWLGDIGLFAAFVDSLGLPGVLAGRLKRVAGRPRLLQAELARTEPRGEPASGQLAALLAELSEAEAAGLLEEIWALAGVEPVGGRRPAEIAARLVRRAEAAAAPALSLEAAQAIGEFMAISDTPQAAIGRIRALAGRKARAIELALGGWERRLAKLAGVVPAAAMRFAPALGHAFDYYDGLTFEVRSQALGPQRPVAVGGRYDGLLGRLGARNRGQAVGCMVRPWRALAGGEA